ncbi:ribonuclease HI [Candidatus Saccharibacteria bacterium]|jgi:ribonuclease HI|nr:ribonuclease HI [Candidatus Saccharibacteria bacterium]
MKTYYTDGSCSPNPGPGGYSVILVDGEKMEPVRLGCDNESTNIRMEGMALISALEHSDGEKCEIFTDSEFWINVITKWSLTWEANGWQKKGGIKNLDIVQEVCPLYRKSQAKLTWVRGHVGDPGNEMADSWANKARSEKLVV